MELLCTDSAGASLLSIRVLVVFQDELLLWGPPDTRAQDRVGTWRQMETNWNELQSRHNQCNT